MIELPTPETDALFWRNGYPVEVDSSKAMQLCEKLEQERDWITEKFKLLEGCFKRAERERDEAREHLRAANKGAETNAKINQSLANQIINANAMADKAKELIARWDMPSWKDTAPTAGFIYALRDAVEAYEKGKR